MDKVLNEETILPVNSLAIEISKGLSATPKTISSKYFYDAEGDRLFQKIMNLDEYYLSRTEYAILENHRETLHKHLTKQGRAFHLIEFGAGDGWKTKVLLRHFVDQATQYDYRPIDISGNVLTELKNSLKAEIPLLRVETMEGEYFEVLEDMQKTDDKQKVVLFLGSNIGNFKQSQAIGFLSKLRDSLNTGDMLLIGFDMKKDPHVIRQAYDDPQGVTRDFNMNLLKRLNIELGANFDLGHFKHYQSYDPVSGECKSYLISLADQTVTMEASQSTYHFKKWEPIHVEISRKFDEETIQELALRSGFDIIENLTDERGYFIDSLWVAGQ